ncbi:protein kinase [Streptomyces sp. H10-C2]|uniref:serine/threonine protein kinase n=1 Tax=unclassified Streptomyces TaxID=2593676 RepID=UPI0024B8E044|nr:MULTISPECIES: serine/threonine protein kinase [unclassified Streptomyces]MDJ0347462.1 protein kinase [Streptomyces sp. PH10-H1]MDJ0368844.1 protein kinase [Streptomyces sp. H10-C2]
MPGYRALSVLGAGGSGKVVHAVDERSGAEVAVKYLNEESRSRPGLLGSFRDEARLLQQLDSPHVVRVYDYVESAEGAAIVMELIEGVSLGAMLRANGAAVPEAALAVLKGSLLGLAAAHAAGVVHRDYKPGNVMVSTNGVSTLVDFGIAVRQGDDAPSAGTPPYMAPEQWRGEPASPATDVYAATATFFELLTGERPFTGATMAELAVQHITAPIPEDRAPEELRPLIGHGLAKDAAERPASAASFLAELEAAAGAAYGPDWERRGRRALIALVALLAALLPSALGDAGPAGPPSPPPPGAAAGLPFGGGKPRRMPRGRGAALVGGTVALLALATAGTVVALAGNGNAKHHADGLTAPPSSTTTLTGSSAPDTSATGDATTGPSVVPVTSVSTSPTPTATSTTPDATTGPPTTSATATTPPVLDPPTSTSASPTITTTPAPVVSFMGVTAITPGRGRSATATVAITASGTGRFTLTVDWYYANAKSTAANPGSRDGATWSMTLEGKTKYEVSTDSHTFGATGCTPVWGVLASTNPSAVSSRPYRTTPGPQCPLR